MQRSCPIQPNSITLSSQSSSWPTNIYEHCPHIHTSFYSNYIYLKNASKKEEQAYQQSRQTRARCPGCRRQRRWWGLLSILQRQARSVQHSLQGSFDTQGWSLRFLPHSGDQGPAREGQRKGLRGFFDHPSRGTGVPGGMDRRTAKKSGSPGRPHPHSLRLKQEIPGSNRSLHCLWDRKTARISAGKGRRTASHPWQLRHPNGALQEHLQLMISFHPNYRLSLYT